MNKRQSTEIQQKIARLQEACALDILLDFKYEIERILPAIDRVLQYSIDPLERDFQIGVRLHVERLYAQHLQRLRDSN